jgi:hypothetical protein
MKIFFHVFTENNCLEIVNEMLSPILHLKDNIIICKVGNKPIPDFGIKIIEHNNNNFEFDTLNLLHNYCKDNLNEKVCYVHTKGVTTPNNECINDWRKYMSYFALDKYKDCLSKLDEYDTCGVDLVNIPTKHYSGNFWWARADYIASLKSPKDIELLISERHKCEFWICSGQSKKHYSFHNSDINVYERHLHRYSEDKYKDLK